MNKRILELAEQAYEYVESEYNKWVSTPNFSEFPNTRKIFDEKFAELFPGLMKRIVTAVQSNGEEIKKNSTEIMSGGYDISKAVSDLKNKFPVSYNSGETEPEAEQDIDTTPGTYVVTQIASGRSARISGESKQDVVNKILQKYPDSTEADYSFERAPD